MGREQNAELLEYFKDRTIWLLELDVRKRSKPEVIHYSEEVAGECCRQPGIKVEDCLLSFESRTFRSRAAQICGREGRRSADLTNVFGVARDRVSLPYY